MTSPNDHRRILHVITMLEIGGAQYNTILSAEDSIRRGHDARVVAAPGPLAAEARRRLNDRFIELPSLRREISPIHDIAAFIALIRLMRRLQPEIVHTHSSKAGILGRWAARLAGVPRIMHTAHGWGFHRGQRPLVRRLYQLVERITARITDRLIVVSEANRRDALEVGIGRPDQYVTIRSGIAPADDVTPLAAAEIRTDVRREFGIPDDVFLLLAVGNTKAQKNPAAMARIAASLLAARPDAHFLAAGDGPGRVAMEAILAPWIPARVRLAGWRPDPRRLMRAADLLLHTPLFEGLPRVLLEALSVGLPILSTDVDGISEAVRDGVSGLLFAVEDEPGMMNALMRLHDDPLLRRRLAAGAAAAFRREFTLEEMFARLDREYRLAAPLPGAP